MPDTFPLGSIPPLSAWQGETLSFKVTSTLGEGTKFSKLATPGPKGKISLDENTGVFVYQPSAEDKEQFTVSIRASKDTRDEKQVVYVTPHPNVPSDFRVIEHVSVKKPDDTSAFYTTLSRENADEAYFNRTGLEGEAKVMTKKATIVGVNVVIDDKKDPGLIFERLKERTNLKQLIICADEVVLRCELKVPGTDVHIYARELRFEDTDGRIARIDTTPLPITAHPTKFAAMRGQKGGDVYLFVKNLVVPGTQERIIANGGKGQPGQHGQQGRDGTSVEPWNGKVLVEGTELDLSGELKNGFENFSEADRKEIEKGKPIMVSVYQKVQTREEFRFHWPADHGPTDGKDPVASPRGPGAGGDGGSVYTQFEEKLEQRVNLSAGEVGLPADDVPPSKAGEPSPALRYALIYSKAGPFPPQPLKFFLQTWYKTKPGVVVRAPQTSPFVTKAGKIRTLQSKSGESHWLHLAAVRAVIAYAEDLCLAGYTKKALEKLEIYLDAVKVAAASDKDEPGWALLQNELTAMVQRVKSPYDSFGNPAGWVPMLSFQTNYQLFNKEMESAVRVMFLAYWVQFKKERAKAAADILEAAKERLYQENVQALADLEVAEAKVRELSSSMFSIADQIVTIWNQVTNMKKSLANQAKNDLQLEHRLRASAKILGGVMQLIPVGQPALGSFGKALTVLGDIDTDDPTASLGKVAGAFSPVATKIAEKGKDLGKKVAEGLFEDLMRQKQLALTEQETIDRDEKKKFDTAVEKKDFESKVKKYMEEREEAKAKILEGFSGLAVSEEDVQERLEKVLADTPAYENAIKAIEKLNVRKRDFSEKLVATLNAIGALTTTILNNQIAILELQGQRDTILEQISPEALQAVQEMGRKARERLLLYQYYLLKSYHYLRLADLPDIDFQAVELFKQFATLLTKNENGMLTQEQYESLSVIFSQQLRGIAQKIIDWYSKNDAATQNFKVVSLTPDQIATLNSSAKRVEIDLLVALNRQEDNIRIVDIETDEKLLELAQPYPDEVVTAKLDYIHDGISKVRRHGKLYLFRSGQYRVEETAGKPRTAIHWASNIEYNPRVRMTQLTVTQPERDPEARWLLNELISQPNSNKNPMTRFRPGAWTRLAIQRSGSDRVKFQRLALRIKYIADPIDPEYSTVVVKVADGVAPLIRCSALDENGSGDGTGSFLRTFKKEQESVTLTAPAYYGGRALLGWRQDEAVEKRSAELKGGESYTVSLNKPDCLVEPVYAPPTATVK